MQRLKSSQIQEWRLYLHSKQQGICPLCGTYISLCNEDGKDESALDHCHETGHIRAVLHLSCNASEGRILQFADKRCRSEDPKSFLINMVEYWERDHSNKPYHPNHSLPEEKERLQLKRKLKNLKALHAIKKTKDRITELNEIIKLELVSVPAPDEWFK